MTSTESLRAKLIGLRTALLGVQSLSTDAKVEAAALVALCDAALADLSTIEAQRAQPRPSALSFDAEAAPRGLLFSETVH